MNKKYRKRGLIIGLVVGIVYFVVVIAPIFFPGLVSFFPQWFGFVFLFLSIISLLLTSIGAFGCNFKIDDCYTEMMAGYIITVLVCTAIGYAIGLAIDKNKSASSN